MLRSVSWLFSQVGMSVVIGLIAVFAVTVGRSYRLHALANHMQVCGIRCTAAFDPRVYAWRALGFAGLAVCTFGLSIPWATVSQRRWLVQRFSPAFPCDWAGVELLDEAQSRPTGVADGLAELLGAEFA